VTDKKQDRQESVTDWKIGDAFICKCGCGQNGKIKRMTENLVSNGNAEFHKHEIRKLTKLDLALK
jgi:hypothetical protein